MRRMSKRHGIHTDASHRFERGADFESTVPSTNRVAELILASGGGTLIGDVIDESPANSTSLRSNSISVKYTASWAKS